MISKPKAMALLVALSVLAIVSSALIEARLLEDHFLNAAVDQFKNNAEQLAGAVVDFDVPAGDNETCREIALWIYYNTGMRVLITDADSIVVVDSSSDSSLVGTAIESEDLKSTIATGETRSFDLPQAGQDHVAISVPWRSSAGISGSMVMVAPLKSIARRAADQLKPSILKSSLGGLLVAVIGGAALSPALARGSAPQTSHSMDEGAGDQTDETAATDCTCPTAESDEPEADEAQSL